MWARVVEEVRNVFPAWVFFLLAFFLLYLTQTVTLAEHHLPTLPPSRVWIGSFLVAKALLLVDVIPGIKKLDQRPVLVSALWKTLSYFVIVFLMQYLEELVALRGIGVRAASREFRDNLRSTPFWILQMWLVLLLFSFSMSRDLFRKLGRRQFQTLFLGRSWEP